MALVLLITIIVWLILSVLVGSLGGEKKIGFGGAFLISLLVSPLFGVLFVIASDKVEKVIPVPDEVSKLTAEGKRRFLDKDYAGATQCYQQVIALHPKAPNSNFRLACIFSHQNNLEDSFKHLDLAIQQGFTDFALIQSTPELEQLRELPKFKQYVQNGYKTVDYLPQEDVVIKLEKLASLKEKGHLTDEEYQAQKKRLLQN
jgi:hypothetical protein